MQRPLPPEINAPISAPSPQLEDPPNPELPMPISVEWPSAEFQKEMESLLTRATNQCPDWIDKYPHMHAATVCAFNMNDIKEIQASWNHLGWSIQDHLQDSECDSELGSLARRWSRL